MATALVIGIGAEDEAIVNKVLGELKVEAIHQDPGSAPDFPEQTHMVVVTSPSCGATVLDCVLKMQAANQLAPGIILLENPGSSRPPEWQGLDPWCLPSPPCPNLLAKVLRSELERLFLIRELYPETQSSGDSEIRVDELWMEILRRLR